ncbi:MAG: hypothetical protein LBL84_02220 [Candidatus Nomurabacteria bacterium]|jgi:hypothetical protein|nr:hypothetical protein [Candidatus Nomurabacteria bacterium]
MLLMSLFSWWYSGGLKKEAIYLVGAMSGSLDFFSIGLLVKTLFAPFRQIDAGGSAQAPVDVQLKMFFDRLLSRIIGAFMRTIVILIGIAALVLQFVGSVLATLLYLLLPILPIAGAIMYIIGWVPQWPF